MKIDLSNKKKSPFNFKVKLLKVLWFFVRKVFFYWSYHKAFAYRRFILRVFGAKLQSTSYVYRDTLITMPWNLTMGENSVLAPQVICYNTAKVIIGNNATVSQMAYLCSATHDVTVSNFQLVAYPIIIGDGCWVAAQAFIGPGTQLKENVVIGARAVVSNKCISENEIWAGNPAVFIKKR